MVHLVAGTIAIIPARGGSKRIPGKNVVDFHGHPLLAWTIEAALACERFARVIVSTDAEDIAEIAVRYGAEVPFLRSSLADDHTASSLVTLQCLEQAEAQFGLEFQTVAQLLPTCPLRTEVHIADAVDHFVGQGIAFQISVVDYGGANPWWAHTREESGIGHPAFPDKLAARSQDLPRVYCPTGAIWLADSVALKKARNFYGPGYALWSIDRLAGIDIDDGDDLALARGAFQQFEQKRSMPGARKS